MGNNYFLSMNSTKLIMLVIGATFLITAINCAGECSDLIENVSKFDEDFKLVWGEAINYTCIQHKFLYEQKIVTDEHLASAKEMTEDDIKGLSCYKTTMMLWRLFTGKVFTTWDLTTPAQRGDDNFINSKIKNWKLIAVFIGEHTFSIIVLDDKVYVISSWQAKYDIHDIINQNPAITKNAFKALWTKYTNADNNEDRN